MSEEPTAGENSDLAASTEGKTGQMSGVSRLLGKIKMKLTTLDDAMVANQNVKDVSSEPTTEKMSSEAVMGAENMPIQQNVKKKRKLRARISHIDPWSAMKVSFLFSVAFSIIGFVAVAVLWIIVDSSGALKALQDSVTSLVGRPDGSGGFDVTRYIDQWRVLGFTAIVSVINIVLFTALSTLMSFLYNLAATILGGFEVTLSEN